MRWDLGSLTLSCLLVLPCNDWTRALPPNYRQEQSASQQGDQRGPAQSNRGHISPRSSRELASVEFHLILGMRFRRSTYVPAVLSGRPDTKSPGEKTPPSWRVWG